MVFGSKSEGLVSVVVEDYTRCCLVQGFAQVVGGGCRQCGALKA